MTTARQLYSARAELTHAIAGLSRATLADTGIGYVTSATAPDTWDKLQAVDLSIGVLPVWDGASADCLYLTAEHNYAFRFWHDMGHLEHGLSFTPADEHALQENHHLPIIASIVGHDTLAYRLYRADTVGQIEHIERHGVFPADQLAFDMAYVADRERALSVA